jgi:hypothetical protein
LPPAAVARSGSIPAAHRAFAGAVILEDGCQAGNDGNGKTLRVQLGFSGRGPGGWEDESIVLCCESNCLGATTALGMLLMSTWMQGVGDFTIPGLQAKELCFSNEADGTVIVGIRRPWFVEKSKR